MDQQPCRLVRPFSTLLFDTVLGILSRPNARLSVPVADALLLCGSNDHVEHSAVLSSLSRTLSQCGEAKNGPAALPLRVAQPLLLALQRFPRSCEEQKLNVEGQVVRSLQSSLSETALSSTEVSQAWAVLAQLSSWASVRALSSQLPLVRTLPLQSADEFADVLSAVCACTQQSGVPGAVVEHRRDLLTELIGTSEAWRRCEESLHAAHAGGAAARARGGALPQRASSAVLMGATLHSFPFSEPQWAALTAPAAHRLPSLAGTSLPRWLQRAAALQHAALPTYVRASCEEAMVNDLHSIYAERTPESTLLFYILGLPAMLRDEVLLNTDVAATARVFRAVRDYHVALLRRYCDSARQTAESSTARVGALVNVLLGASFARGIQDAGEDVQAMLTDALGALQRAIEASLREQRAAAVKANPVDSRSHSVDMRVRYWPVMDSACVTVVLEQALPVTASATVGGTVDARSQARQRILDALKSSGVLTAEVLRAHGSPRAISTLLAHAPRTLCELGLRDECVQLLESHAEGSLTRHQLCHIIATATGTCETGDTPTAAAAALALPSALIDRMRRHEQTLPGR